MIPSKVNHPEFGRLEVLSTGHYPDTLMVKDSTGRQFEIPYKQLFLKGEPDETNPSQGHNS